MNGAPGLGFPPQFIAHFPPIAPGPAGNIIAIPAGALPASPTVPSDPSKPTDSEILDRILATVAKVSHQVRTNGKALREIATQQCAIAERLDTLEQDSE